MMIPTPTPTVLLKLTFLMYLRNLTQSTDHDDAAAIKMLHTFSDRGQVRNIPNSFLYFISVWEFG